MRISEAIEKFSSWRALKVKANTTKGYDLVLRQFCLYMRDCEVESIVEEDVTQWFHMMLRLGWDRNSFIPKAIALRKLFEYLELKGYPVLNPDLVPIPSKEYKMPRIASEEGYEKLLSIIPEDTKDGRHIRNRAIIMMLWDTGARVSELMSVDLGDLDIEHKRAVIKTEKSRGFRPIREIFWTEKTNINLRHWLDKREQIAETIKKNGKEIDPCAVFVSIMSSGLNDKAGKRFDKKGVGEMLRRYANRAGIPPLNAHSFRHHFGRDLAKNDINNSTISSLMGHSSVQSSFVYTLLFNKDAEQKYREVKGE